MEENKVYLFVETPFSLQGQKGRQLLIMLLAFVVDLGVIAFYWLTLPEYAMLVTAVMACLFLMNACLIAVFRLSYVTVEEEYLVCRYGGFIPKRIRLSSRLRGKVIAGQLRVLSGGAMLLSMPDSDAARRLLAVARIPMEP